MTSKDLVGLLITIAVGLVIIIVALILLSGRGAFFIAGYNTASDEEKKKYDPKLLSRFIGKILIPIGLGLPSLAIAGIYKIKWLPFIYLLINALLVIYAVVYCNFSNRVKK